MTSKSRLRLALLSSVKKEILLKLCSTPILILLYRHLVFDDIDLFLGSYDQYNHMLSVLVRITIQIFTMFVMSKLSSIMKETSTYLSVRIGSVSQYFKEGFVLQVILIALFGVYDGWVMMLIYKHQIDFIIIVYSVLIILAQVLIVLVDHNDFKIRGSKISISFLILLSIVSGMMPSAIQFSVITMNITYLIQNQSVQYCFAINTLIRLVMIIILYVFISIRIKGGKR